MKTTYEFYVRVPHTYEVDIDALAKNIINNHPELKTMEDDIHRDDYIDNLIDGLDEKKSLEKSLL